jgi:glucose uptake protein
MLGGLGEHNQTVSWLQVSTLLLGLRSGALWGPLLWGLSLGSFGGAWPQFVADALHADSMHCLLAFAGGVIFNIANLLLVAAIDTAGLAVAFPVGIGLALVIGAASSYAIGPSGNTWMLFGGITLVRRRSF